MLFPKIIVHDGLFVNTHARIYVCALFIYGGLDISKPLPERMVCSEDDFETMLLIGHKLLMHSAMMFQMLPENKDAAPGEIGHTLIQKQFFEMLPADFTKQDAVKQAQVLGVSVRTMEKWIDKLVQSTDIVRVTHGQYQKRECKIA